MAKILLVDDDPNVLQLLGRALRKAGYVVSCADTGQDGLAAFHDDPADVVVTDIFIPGENGYDLITKIRKIDAAVGIIAMSSRDTMTRSTVLRVARELGADDTIRKPVSTEKFLSLVHELVAMKQKRLENAADSAKRKKRFGMGIRS